MLYEIFMRLPDVKFNKKNKQTWNESEEKRFPHTLGTKGVTTGVRPDANYAQRARQRGRET